MTVFAISLATSVVVTALWNLVAHGGLAIDWETSLRFAIVFGIVLTWIDRRRSKAG